MEKRIQVTAGNGPKECDYLVHHLQDIILKEASLAGLSTEILEQSFKDELRSCFTLKLKGDQAEAFLARWLGSICWINRSPFRPKHKRKNWFVGIYELAEEHNISLCERDILYQTMRSSGPGGQHVNKVNSAVRALHIPTGIIVQVMDTRSQLQNRKLAYQRLLEKIQQLQQLEWGKSQQQAWENQSAVVRGNAKRIFRGDKFKEL